MYITCHGLYEAVLNGRRVGDFVLAPGVDDYKKRLQVQAYDVTALLREGENKLRVTLGDGWYRGNNGIDGSHNLSGSDLALLCQLEADGKVILVSDETWEASQDCPVRQNDMELGEVYDARMEKFSGWHGVTVRKYGYICTINEANMGLQLAAIEKRFRMMAEQAARRARSAEGTVQVGMNFEKMMENMKFAAMENAQVFGTPKPQTFVSARTPAGDELVMRAHRAAKAAIKAVCPELKVGLTLSLHDLQALPGGEAFAEAAWEEEFRHYLPFIGEDDFLGVQNYTRTQYGPQGQLPCPEGAELTQMDYEFYPEALEHVLRKVAEDFKGDLIVTENGIATADDTRRVEFIRRALSGVEACVRDGLPVKGYFHWSLMDNFEWQKGYTMTFGLIAVDRSTQTRSPKPSLAYLGSFAAKG